MAIFRSASAETMMALLPPSSRIERPRRAATAAPTDLPMRVEPVAETRAMRVLAANTSSTMCWQARAQSGVFSEGFQIQVLPQTQASILFQLHTATGKLKAE